MFILARSPLRISFVGGGSDLPSFCHEEPGRVVSAAIDRYVYISVAPRYSGIRVSYSRTENVDRVDAIQHDIVRETLKHLMLDNVEIVSMADISAGAGLGSSGAFTTALLTALYALNGVHPYPESTFNQASTIEMIKCNKPIGYQDQAASAFGGFASYTFNGSLVSRDDLSFCKHTDDLFSRLLLVDTGLRGRSTDALNRQSFDRDATRLMADLASTFVHLLLNGEVDECGGVINDYWKLKRSLGASNDQVDSIYAYAHQRGAIGGKLCGAGGRGMMLFITHPGMVRSLASDIYEKFDLRTLIPHLSRDGARIVYSSG